MQRVFACKLKASLQELAASSVLLAGQLGASNMPADFADKDKYLSDAPVAVPTIPSSSTSPADWLQAVTGSPLTFKAQNVGAASSITFASLCSTHHQRYSVHWTLPKYPSMIPDWFARLRDL